MIVPQLCAVCVTILADPYKHGVALPAGYDSNLMGPLLQNYSELSELVRSGQVSKFFAQGGSPFYPNAVTIVSGTLACGLHATQLLDPKGRR